MQKYNELMGKIVLIGCGGVAFSFLELLTRVNIIPKTWYSRGITVIEPKDITKHPIYPYIQVKLNHIQVAVTKANYRKLLNEHVQEGDIIVDLSVNVDSLMLINWCIANNVKYINTSMENWSIKKQEVFKKSDAEVIDRTLYMQQIKLERLKKKHKKCSTIVIDHGMNPGLISHFVKMGILKYAYTHKVIDHGTMQDMLTNTDTKVWSKLAKKLGLRLIHCSELDTQKLKYQQRSDVFYNTWSVDGFLAEGRDPVQIGYGSHEDYISHPYDGLKAVIPKVGPKHQIFLPIRGMDLVVKSYVPHQEILGYAIPHGEAYSLPKFFTCKSSSSSKGGNKSYRPSMYYVYSCSEPGAKSMNTVRNKGYKELPHEIVLTSFDIASGYDAVGALLAFASKPKSERSRTEGSETKNGYNCWWSGTILDISNTSGKFKTGPTVIQVAISLINTVEWMIKNPDSGIRHAEELPLTILMGCEPYLGKVYIDKVDWKPKSIKFQDLIHAVLEK